MVEVRSRVSEFEYLEPAVLDSRTVRYWSQSTKECVGSQHSKAKKLLDYDCVKYAGINEFVVLPLNSSDRIDFAGQSWPKKPYPKDYNKKDKPYVLTKNGESWRCNCQWHVKMNGAMCAHILALKWAFKMRLFNRGEKN